MMKINMVPSVNSWDVEEEFGMRIFDCNFTEMVENDSYVCLALNEEHIEDLKDNIEYCREHDRVVKAEQYENELDLVNKFRELGYKDEIIIFVSW